MFGNYEWKAILSCEWKKSYDIFWVGGVINLRAPYEMTSVLKEFPTNLMQDGYNFNCPRRNTLQCGL